MYNQDSAKRMKQRLGSTGFISFLQSANFSVEAKLKLEKLGILQNGHPNREVIEAL